MNKVSYLHLSIGAVSLLLINLLLTMPAEANGFSCRGSALRIDEPLGLIFEPEVANPPDAPCATDAKALLSVGPVLGVGAGVLGADTEDTAAPISAEGFAVSVSLANVLGLVNASADVLDAEAHVNSVNGKCVVSSNSSVTSAVIQGTPITLLTTHQDVPILNALGINVATLHLNETLGGNNPTSGPHDPSMVTQRALWLQVTNPLLQSLGLRDVVVGEAIADFAGGNPCATTPPPADKRRMTGGGKFTNGTTTVTTGFVLHCAISRTPNNLEVNWGSGNKFHLASLASASCFEGTPPNEGQPPAGFNTYVGSGTGSFNGVSGATAAWTFTDHGEPGAGKDTAEIHIKDNTGTSVLDVPQTTLSGGNFQAHP
jgi:hypothetical protein